MKIKSKIDVITNSSSECYQIKNTSEMTVEEFKKKWFDKLIEEHYFDKEGNCIYEHLRDTYEGTIYSEANYLYLDYPVMCNIDFDILKVLKEWFGDNNVEATW